MKSLYLTFILLVFGVSLAFSQSVTMEVKQGPNIDVMLTVGQTSLDFMTLEDDLKAALLSKGIDPSKINIQAFQRSTTSTNDQDASAIFNSWTNYPNSIAGWELTTKNINGVNKSAIGTTVNSSDYVNGWSGFLDPGKFDAQNYTFEFKLIQSPANDNDLIGFSFRQKDGTNY